MSAADMLSTAIRNFDDADLRRMLHLSLEMVPNRARAQDKRVAVFYAALAAELAEEFSRREQVLAELEKGMP